MTDARHEQPDGADETPRMIQPAESAPDRVAAELFAHGLLGALEDNTSGATERRVRRVMDTLAPAPIPISRWRIQWRAIAAAAAAVTIVAMLFLYERFPLENTAVAEAAIASAIKASRSPGDQRYEVRIVREGDGEVPSVAEATIDTRAPNMLLLQAQTPDGHIITAGRDAEGEWALRPDGRIDRDLPRGAWPRWMTANEQSIFADSIDVILEALAKRYTLTKGEPDPQVPSLEHIVGKRKQGGGPAADQIDVFIDRTTNLVERLEMRWSPESQQEMKRRWQDRLRQDGPRDGTPKSLAAPPDERPGMPPPMLAERGQGRDGPRGGGRGEPRGDGRDGPRGEPRGMGRGEGHGPDGPPPPECDGRLRPRLGFGGGMPPPGKRFGPPRLFVIERVETPPFTDSWFSPDDHMNDDNAPATTTGS
ncbi:MAG: hypothetical protein JNM94_03560 [Phycisphaerae bacterium]|nr:hypothetical protein [Phycisphaerae bacterium]